MELEQMTYPDALRWLAKKYKIEIQERELTNEENSARAKENPCLSSTIGRRNIFRIFSCMMWMASLSVWPISEEEVSEMISSENSSWVLRSLSVLLFTEAAKAAGYNPKYLVDTGLCFKVDKDEAGNKSGEDKILDRFSGRAIFPWFSVSGKVVALADECSTAEPRASARNMSTRLIALSIIRSANSMDSIRPRRR